MKTILIIYPHWHPANLAGVHRPRLIGNYLKELGWTPRILTVNKKYYEETPDPDFEKTFSPDFVVTRVKALPVTQPRLIGDIGLRAFFQLYREARQIIRNESIDFIWLPIPSFYNALLGRLLYEKTKVPYGIDYIDPWVRDLTNQKNLRARISQFFAKLLEPIAIKKASLISGVSYPYYEPVIKRNFPTIYSQLANQPLNSSIHQFINPYTRLPFTHVAMPYGFDPSDHTLKIGGIQYPWEENKERKIWLYAGAFLPNSHVILKAFFESIKNLRKTNQWDETIDLWFIGTGNYPAKSIESYAHDYDLTDMVTEHRQRYPFLHVLNYLAAANTVMIIGSTEKHYTASKTFQALLSQRPVIAAFHQESSAIQVMRDCEADTFTVGYNPDMTHAQLVKTFEEIILKQLASESWTPNLNALEQYSSKEGAKKLVEAIESVL